MGTDSRHAKQTQMPSNPMSSREKVRRLYLPPLMLSNVQRDGEVA